MHRGPHCHWLFSSADPDDQLADLQLAFAGLPVHLEKLAHVAPFKPWKSSDRRGASRLKAIFIRDSFASRLAPYFSRSFSEVIYLHNKMLGLAKLGQLIEEFQPDVVLYEYAERNLDSPEEQVLAPLVDSLDR